MLMSLNCVQRYLIKMNQFKGLVMLYFRDYIIGIMNNSFSPQTKDRFAATLWPKTGNFYYDFAQQDFPTCGPPNYNLYLKMYV